MVETDEEVGGFKFDPEQFGDISELAEAFIRQEVDADLFDELDRDYLEQLVDNAESEPSAGIETKQYEAAIEVAELILGRMDATDY